MKHAGYPASSEAGRVGNSLVGSIHNNCQSTRSSGSARRQGRSVVPGAVARLRSMSSRAEAATQPDKMCIGSMLHVSPVISPSHLHR